MKTKIKLLFFLSLTFFIVIACEISFFEEEVPPVPTNTSQPPATLQPTPEPTLQPTVESTVQPTQQTVPAGWQTYTSTVYGFEISYPASYQALDDADNLYGWPNGVVLLYNGGQAYDIAIQVWDSPDEIASNYPSAGESITIVPSAGKYISIFNATEEGENPAIIATFKLINQ
ncbi:MAG: hypothetical protein MUO42_12940 [Anaerolineaceae bacterium]|jgi:hypothetical protein|nr:hypothetical protein [Anaerolineaceae bacterium]